MVKKEQLFMNWMTVVDFVREWWLVIVPLGVVCVLWAIASKTQKKAREVRERDKANREHIEGLNRDGFLRLQAALANLDVPFVFEEYSSYGDSHEIKGRSRGKMWKAWFSITPRVGLQGYAVNFFLNEAAFPGSDAATIASFKKFHDRFMVNALRHGNWPAKFPEANQDPFPFDRKFWPVDFSGAEAKEFHEFLLNYENLWERSKELRERFVAMDQEMRSVELLTWEEVNRLAADLPTHEGSSSTPLNVRFTDYTAH